MSLLICYFSFYLWQLSQATNLKFAHKGGTLWQILDKFSVSYPAGILFLEKSLIKAKAPASPVKTTKPQTKAKKALSSAADPSTTNYFTYVRYYMLP